MTDPCQGVKWSRRGTKATVATAARGRKAIKVKQSVYNELCHKQ